MFTMRVFVEDKRLAEFLIRCRGIAMLEGPPEPVLNIEVKGKGKGKATPEASGLGGTRELLLAEIKRLSQMRDPPEFTRSELINNWEKLAISRQAVSAMIFILNRDKVITRVRDGVYVMSDALPARKTKAAKPSKPKAAPKKKTTAKATNGSAHAEQPAQS